MAGSKKFGGKPGSQHEFQKAKPSGKGAQQHHHRRSQQQQKRKPAGKNGTEDFLNDLDNFEDARAGKAKIATHETLDLESEEEEEERAVFNVGAEDDDEDSKAEDEEEQDYEDDDAEDEDEDDDDEELDRETERVMRKLKIRKPFVDEDGILGEKKTKVISEKAWGKKKTSYYQAEDVDEEGGSDDDALKDEEEEARRLQKEKYSSMQDEDFGGDADDSFKAIIEKKASKKQAAAVEPKSSNKKKVEKADNQGAGTAPAKVEKIKKDISSLSKEELTEIISNESPELLELLADFKVKVAEVKNNLHPIMERVRRGELPMSKGISFLEVKYHVMLSYLTNISFYLLLKATGGKVKDHPVINQLVELRTVMEKIKPLEQKLQYQIDKLVRTANTGEMAKGDPLRFKPNPESMLKGAMANGDNDQADKDEVYHPTKIAPVHYEEPKDKKRRQEERLKQKASRSRLLQDLKEEFSDQPEAHVYREELDEYDRQQQEKLLHEEEYFVRLPVTKQDKKKAKKRIPNELTTFDDFGDLAALEKSDVTSGLMSGKKRKAPEHDDVPERGGSSILDALDDVANEFGGEGEDLDDSYYQEVKAAKKKAKKQKKEEAAMAAAQELMLADDGDEGAEEGEDGKRGLTNSMLKNRGLTAKKKKAIKNPRVKRRVKYEEAKKKLNSIMRPVADKSKPYQGEMTGIKSNLARSVKIK